MRVAFRADASLTIGTGHIMRCLTLAGALRGYGAECIFFSRDHPGNLHQLVREQGFQLMQLGPVDETSCAKGAAGGKHWLGVDQQRDAEDTLALVDGLAVNWMVVDHYGIDAAWERALRQRCARILVIDDLANRPHSADALLDQNLGKSALDYGPRVPPNCKLMLGTDYALLRPEFAALRSVSLERRRLGQLRKVLVTMGGVDLDNATGSVLDALKRLGDSFDLEVTVVMGLHSPWREGVLRLSRSMPFQTEVLTNVKSMGALMCEADIGIGAAGSTSWERCCMGLPTLQLVLADNQRAIADEISQAGAALLLNRTEIGANTLKAFKLLQNYPAMLIEMSEKAAKLVDGHGGSRVAQHLMVGNPCSEKPATLQIAIRD